jgi:hypothetical protein
MSPTLLLILSALMLCLGTVVGLRDKSLIFTNALPNGAAATTSTVIDLESTPPGDFLAPIEFELTVPALTTTQLGDTQTITYSVEMSATSGFGSTTVLYGSIGVQTGAGGAGDVALTRRFRLPTNVLRYVRVRATKTGASNASTASMIVSVLQLA